jgi:DNA-binding transcriptional MerR regulator
MPPAALAETHPARVRRAARPGAEPPPAGARAGDRAATFTIGELAREFDLTTRAIRFYEDCGLLTPQRAGRHRVYTLRDRTRLKLTLRGKRLGLTLAEVKQLVDMYESPRDTAPQLKRFLEVLAAHRAELEERLADINATLDEVRLHEREARRLLQRERATPAGGPAAPRRPSRGR